MFAGVVLCSAVLTATSRVSAADTVETWDVGATDVDLYVGLEGVAATGDERSFFGDMMLGYGLVDRLSAYLGTTLRGNPLATDATTEHYVGVFGTPVDADHFDLDVFLEVRVHGQGNLRRLHITPSTELNLDADPGHGSWGAYLRAGVPVYGYEDPRAGDAGGRGERAASSVELEPGLYVSIADGHQVLAEYDMAFHRSVDDGERGIEVGGVAAGYNATLSPAIELIGEVHVDIPQAGEAAAVAVTTGLIATLPARAARPDLARDERGRGRRIDNDFHFHDNPPLEPSVRP